MSICLQRHVSTRLSHHQATIRTIYAYKLGKGKVHPRAGHESPEGEQSYSSTLSLTSALYGGGWSTTRPGLFTTGKDAVPIL
jgi:hypothetical protein